MKIVLRKCLKSSSWRLTYIHLIHQPSNQKCLYIEEKFIKICTDFSGWPFKCWRARKIFNSHRVDIIFYRLATEVDRLEKCITGKSISINLFILANLTIWLVQGTVFVFNFLPNNTFLSQHCTGTWYHCIPLLLVHGITVSSLCPTLHRSPPH